MSGNRIRKPINIGEIFFRLKVIDKAPVLIGSKGQNIYCVSAKCECGNVIYVPEYKLRSNHTKSCGCLQIEKAKKNLPGKTHGLTRTPEHYTWQSMLHRCSKTYNTSYKNYGAKGIKVCERWHKFENFLADMGKRPSENHTLDRINPKGNYEPSNCRWADWNTQSRNRTNNVNVKINNQTMCSSQAAKFLNVHESKISKLVKKLNISHQQVVNILLTIGANATVKNCKEYLKR